MVNEFPKYGKSNGFDVQGSGEGLTVYCERAGPWVLLSADISNISDIMPHFMDIWPAFVPVAP